MVTDTSILQKAPMGTHVTHQANVTFLRPVAASKSSLRHIPSFFLLSFFFLSFFFVSLLFLFVCLFVCFSFKSDQHAKVLSY